MSDNNTNKIKYSLFNFKKIVGGLTSYSDSMKEINVREKRLLDELVKCPKDNECRKFMIDYWRFIQNLNDKTHSVAYTEKIPILLENIDKRIDVLNRLENQSTPLCEKIFSFKF